MRRNARFWRNVAIIGLCHLAVLFGLVRWSKERKKRPVADVVWMESGTFTASAVESPPPVEPEPPPEPEPTFTPPPEEEQILLPPPEEPPPPATPVASEIELPPETPPPTPTPTPTPPPVTKPSPTPTPKRATTPRPTARPKRKAKPKPKATPKRTRPAKESPTATPRPKPTATPRSKEPAPTPAAKAAASPNEKLTNSAAKPAGSGTGRSTTGRGAGNPSQIASYRRRLHDRFYSGWAQPTTTLPAGSKMSALVQVRIEQDGRVSSFKIVRRSGNVVVDDSVAAVAKRVTRVDPLPEGLGNGFYDVRINFELNPEQ